MTFDRSDWEQSLTRRPNGSKLAIETLLQAQVKAEHLTADPHWDTYLSYLQAAVERTREQKNVFEAALNDPTVTDRDEMMRIKISVIRCQERLLAWETALSLPREIIEQGEQAKTILERLGDVS